MTSQKKHTARYQAMLLLSDVVQGKQFINEGVTKLLKQGGLTAPDQALATQLVYGTMQYHYTLECVFTSLVKQPKKVKRWAWELLLLSGYQYFYLDHIPAHAIVNEAVKIAKQRGNQTIARFVNGVLRQLMRQYATIADAIAKLATTPEETLQLRDSLPPKWANYFTERFGRDETALLARSLVLPSHVNVRVNTMKGRSLKEVQQALLNEGYVTTPSEISPHVLRVEQGNPAHSALFAEGIITIQDESASLAVEILKPEPGEVVLDACAAPGGKTVQLAEAVGPAGHVESLDIDQTKLPRIQANVTRMGVAAQVAIHQQDAQRLTERYAAETFDRVLIDAPCSGVGLFRRKPDTKYHKSLADIYSLQQIQLAILEAATPLIKKGGHLVYSTCTITAEENEQVIASYLKQHPEMTIVPIDLPSHYPLQRAKTQQGTLEILPHYFNSDGFFIAHLMKKARVEETHA